MYTLICSRLSARSESQSSSTFDSTAMTFRAFKLSDNFNRSRSISATIISSQNGFWPSYRVRPWAFEWISAKISSMVMIHRTPFASHPQARPHPHWHMPPQD